MKSLEDIFFTQYKANSYTYPWPFSSVQRNLSIRKFEIHFLDSEETLVMEFEQSEGFIFLRKGKKKEKENPDFIIKIEQTLEEIGIEGIKKEKVDIEYIKDFDQNISGIFEVSRLMFCRIGIGNGRGRYESSIFLHDET